MGPAVVEEFSLHLVQQYHSFWTLDAGALRSQVLRVAAYATTVVSGRSHANQLAVFADIPFVANCNAAQCSAEGAAVRQVSE